MEKQGLYPLKFIPILKERIWGGTRLTEFPGKKSAAKCVGESWELSGVRGDVSIVRNGFLKGHSLQELTEIYTVNLVGDAVYDRFGTEFPILVKLIDARECLSIQVHPDDRLAKERHRSCGKTEMWYVMEAGGDSTLIMGFNRETDKESYLRAIETKTLKTLLRTEKVKTGDAFFIPAGVIHAIGKDLLIAEIQQTSDVTYRIYDWDRTDAFGKARELHTGLAVDAIDYRLQDTRIDYPKRDGTVNLVCCPYFIANMVHISQPVEKNYDATDSFVIYICVSGTCRINHGGNRYTDMEKGETVLLPAALKNVRLIPSSPVEMLEVYLSAAAS
ncbi:MAG: class I mannose-6-phosphate isomerase [Bacteroidales bacterium]|jgi:mannose-6-phosphate isomerase|nr:class I mannose-6-phosphate isomerase [Bacteroidales bacterium]